MPTPDPRLAQLRSALDGVTTVEEACARTVSAVTELVACAGTIVALVDEPDRTLRIADVDELAPKLRVEWSRIPLAAPVPLSDVVRYRQPIFLRSRREWLDVYPHLVHLADQTGHQANAVLPLMNGDEVVGALGVAFHEPREFADEEREFALAVASEVARSVQRVRTG
ncbi:MAG TPA: GAF domain-containing protein [Gemmatimonadaceae bacterium]